jgi:hypothetical protein
MSDDVETVIPYSLERNYDPKYTSTVGYCYGVSDCFDGYCKHDPSCPYYGLAWTGPNTRCVRPS